METPPSHRPRSRGGVAGLVRRSPARLAVLAFVAVIAVFAVLLSLPAATESGVRAPLADAVFTAVSAVCVTGLVVVDTARYWSDFGEAVIITGIWVGGFGVLVLASILGLLVSRRMGLQQRLLAQNETKALRLGEVGVLVRIVLVSSVAVQATLAAVLLPRFLVAGEGLGEALWHAVFYGISSFNNAGFVSHPGGLPRLGDGPVAGDWWLSLPIAVGVVVGSLGFPVLLVLRERWRSPRRWGLHTQMTVFGTLVLLVVGAVVIGGMEWTNDATFGALPWYDRVLAAGFASAMPRSGGFSTVDVSQMSTATWVVTDALMFVGGGSASTAGGIRVTTLAVLLLAVVAEARGNRDAEVFGRRVPQGSLRLAVAVGLVGTSTVLVGTVVMTAVTGDPLDVVLFEVVSAFATVGLSVGGTADLPEAGKWVLSALMVVGRTGTMTLAAALALRESSRMFRLPEERPIVG
ncbi:TrkH family potassium uptake protein [Pseudokineococcus basanitobsidens]|uniref:TrkH family potassium uptake protein n=1 Tax=Pseudokineococcus basanitobsidens TaxID=1926649 RepID=UPI003BB6BFC2